MKYALTRKIVDLYDEVRKIVDSYDDKWFLNCHAEIDDLIGMDDPSDPYLGERGLEIPPKGLHGPITTRKSRSKNRRHIG